MSLIRKCLILPFIIVVLLINGLLHGTLVSQVVRHPEDTGRISWGHSDFSRYQRPSMCDRAVAQTWLYNTREYRPDTVMNPLSVDESVRKKIPKDVISIAKTCGAQFTAATVDEDQLWAIARISIAAQDFATSQVAVERLLNLADSNVHKSQILNRAWRMYLSAIPLRMDLVHKYIQLIDELSPQVPQATYSARLALAGFWFEHYESDSVRIYANQAIELFNVMPFVRQETIVSADRPFQYLFDIANESGDIDSMDIVIKRAESVIGGWGGGRGRQWVRQATRLLDFRKTLYGNMSRPLEGSFWFHHNGVPRPVPGKVSLVVLTDHNGGLRQYSQYTALKRLHRNYGDRLDVTLITTSQGYAPGALRVLTPEEEGAEIARYFKEFHKMPFSIVLDEAPTHRLDDGRIIRGPAPLGSLFMDWRGINAFLTDVYGRVQWAGVLAHERDRRVVMATIDRLLVNVVEP